MLFFTKGLYVQTTIMKRNKKSSTNYFDHVDAILSKPTYVSFIETKWEFTICN